MGNFYRLSQKIPISRIFPDAVRFMIGLLGKRRGAGTLLLRLVPDGTRVYAIGDVHGRADLLHQMHERIIEDAAGHDVRRRVVIYLGDYIDRGLQSRAVLDLLSSQPLEGFESVHIKGNHEDYLLRFLDDASICADWFDIGGKATLYSYGVSIPNAILDEPSKAALQEALRRSLPVRHLEFLRNLKPYHVEGDYAFVHAGIRPGVPLDEQSSDDLMWIRQTFLDSKADHGKMIVHGHSNETMPRHYPNRICVDTAAYATGILSCLVLQGTEHSILQTD